MATTFRTVLLMNNMPLYPMVDDREIQRLGRIGQVFQPDGKCKDWTPDQVRGWIADADAIVTSWGSPRLTPELLDAAPRLKFIGHAAGSVATYVDLSAWDRGIT